MLFMRLQARGGTVTGTRKWELRATATGIWLRRDTGTLIMVN